MTQESSKKIQYWVAFAVALASMTTSVAFSWTIPVIPKFLNNDTALSITDTEISWVVVSTTPGTMVGIIASQYQSDNFGRRSTLLASAIPFCVGTMFVLFTTKVCTLYIARFLWGVGAGMIQTVSMIYVAEIASKEIRGSLVVGNRFAFNFGSLLVITIGSFVSYQSLSFLLLVLPVTYIIACWWILETPYFLLKEGNVDAARKVLRKLNGYRDETLLEQELTKMNKHVKEDMRRSTTVKELFTGKQYRRALIISFGLRVCQVMSGTIAIQQYLGSIFQETESSISVSRGLILFAVLRFIVSMMSSGIVDRVGRRPLLICSFIGAFLSLTVIGTCFFIHEVVVIKDYSNLFGNVIFCGIVCFSMTSTIGYETLIFVVPAELFPLNIKSIAMTSMHLFGGVLIFATIRGYQIIKDWTGHFGVFWFFAVVCLVGALFSYCVVPETKGKSLKEIQIELQGPLYEEESENLTKSEVAEKMLISESVKK